jgi:hypothetical protein
MTSKKQLSFHALTNYKLHNARLLIDLVEGQQDAFVRSALLDSALMQLLQAYRCFLGEIAQFAKVDQLIFPDLDSITAKELKLLLLERHQVVPELEEIYLLESRCDSWLYLLFSAYRRSYADKLEHRAVVLNDPDQRSSVSLEGIALQNIADDFCSYVNIDQLKSWRRALSSLVMKMRECLQEW